MKKKMILPAVLLIIALILLSILSYLIHRDGWDNGTAVPILGISTVLIIGSRLSYEHQKEISQI